jgi:hypothetical protein
METTPKKLSITLKVDNLQYLKFFSGNFNLTDKEIKVLSALIETTSELCSTKGRAQAAASLGMSIKVMNTYIKRLKDKRALLYKDNTYTLSRLLERHDHVAINILRKT